MYTREQVLGMVAGRELDKLIGQHIMRYRLYHYDKDIEENCYIMLVDEDFDSVLNLGYVGERDTEEEAWDDCPHFSTDIAAAWEVVEKMRLESWGVTITSWGHDETMGEDPWLVTFGFQRGPCNFMSLSFPEAACKAALLSLLKED